MKKGVTLIETACSILIITIFILLFIKYLPSMLEINLYKNNSLNINFSKEFTIMTYVFYSITTISIIYLLFKLMNKFGDINTNSKINKSKINLKKEEQKIKCSFCEVETNQYRVLTFGFSKEKEFCACKNCFQIAIDNNMKITSIQILKDYIKQENIEFADDYKLKPFYNSKILINNAWITILNEDFFTNQTFNLHLSKNKLVGTEYSNATHYEVDDSNFWLSYLVADVTDNPLLGYMAGKSLTGAMLGSYSHMNSNNSSTPLLIEPEKVSEIVNNSSIDDTSSIISEPSLTNSYFNNDNNSTSETTSLFSSSNSDSFLGGSSDFGSSFSSDSGGSFGGSY